MIIQKNKNKKSQTQRKIKENQYKLVRTHLIDGIYQGMVNSSYQHEGFGILQTDEFHTYLGHFKCNKAHNIGLVIYSSGNIIYANFHKGQIQGPCITDDGVQIKLGLVKKSMFIGIGFQYKYQEQQWKMNRYHKGCSIEIIKIQSIKLDAGTPQMLTVQSELLSHYLNYRNKNYFQKANFIQSEDSFLSNLNNFYCHQLSETHYYFGAFIDDSLQGLGVVYNPILKKTIQAGFYKSGKLEGYGFNSNPKEKFTEYGLFSHGKKDGPFLFQQNNIKKFIKYDKNKMISTDFKQLSLQSFKKNIKIYNYQSKDFVSLKNSLDLDKYKQLFGNGEKKALKIYINTQSKIVKPQESPNNANKNANIYQKTEKTCVDILKDKLNKIKTKKKKHGDMDTMQSIIAAVQYTNNKKEENIRSFDDDQVALEDNPIQQQTIQTLQTVFFSKIADQSYLKILQPSNRKKLFDR